MEKRQFIIDKEQAGLRLDKLLAEVNPDLSRNRIQQLIAAEQVSVSGQSVKKSYQLRVGEKVELVIPPAEDPKNLEPEDIPLEIVYEDKELLVVNKQPDLVVHPAPGHPKGTLVNALLYYCDNLSGINGVKRPGIVHRLDKDTSGALVVAKNDQAHRELARQFKAREIKKEYLTLVKGNLQHRKGKIDAAIGRDPNNRKRMAVTKKNSKQAISRFEVVDRFSGYTLVRVKLETGRTHQIRVHFKYLNHPVVGDELYGGQDSSLNLERQFLHSEILGFSHPQTGEWLEIKAPLYPDLKEVVNNL